MDFSSPNIFRGWLNAWIRTHGCRGLTIFTHLSSNLLIPFSSIYLLIICTCYFSASGNCFSSCTGHFFCVPAQLLPTCSSPGLSCQPLLTLCSAAALISLSQGKEGYGSSIHSDMQEGIAWMRLKQPVIEKEQIQKIFFWEREWNGSGNWFSE